MGEKKKKIRIGSTFRFVFLCLFGLLIHPFSHTIPSHSAQLPRGGGILRQAAVESGSRWLCWLSQYFYRRPRQLWPGVRSHTHKHTQASGFPSIHPPFIPSFRHHFTFPSIRPSVHRRVQCWMCEQLLLSCSEPAARGPPTNWLQFEISTEIETVAAAW